MSKFEQEKERFTKAAEEAGKKIEAGYGTVEKKADKLVEEGEGILAKLKNSKYTAAGIIGASLLAVALWFMR